MRFVFAILAVALLAGCAAEEGSPEEPRSGTVDIVMRGFAFEPNEGRSRGEEDPSALNPPCECEGQTRNNLEGRHQIGEPNVPRVVCSAGGEGGKGRFMLIAAPSLRPWQGGTGTAKPMPSWP